ncbi:YtfJ family protein [Flammeovirga sp. SubArs3]|uniref:YtfJ family protein n=1 Tax=Flammeovirga sp. SubArs3 TaxID=2995316 RepID=UPI00248B4789|nr:YtfJ family protein [Flammeovirga sp. SubArs3]
MKLIYQLTILSLFTFFATSVNAQETLKRGDKIEKVDIRDLNNKPAVTPGIGEKVTLIFYPDPDKPSMNEYFIEEVKKWKFPEDEYIAYGIVNLADSPFPNSVIRFMTRQVRKRSKQEADALILTDPKRFIQDAWNTGDCNNAFSILLVDAEGTVLFWKADEMTEEEVDFVINEIRNNVSTSHKYTEEEMKQFELSK